MLVGKCAFCEKEFSITRSRKKVCSLSCATNLRWRNRKVPEKFDECLQCNALFKFTKNSKKFCSMSCNREYMLDKQLDFKCECCGIDFKIRESTFIARGRVARFCTADCQTDFLRGDRSPAYRGGTYISEESGDVMVQIQSKDAKNGINNSYRALKRIVVENVIGRPLHRTECVINVDGNRLNNDPSNLFVCGLGLTRSIYRYKTQPEPIKGNLDTYK